MGVPFDASPIRSRVEKAPSELVDHDSGPSHSNRTPDEDDIAEWEDEYEKALALNQRLRTMIGGSNSGTPRSNTGVRSQVSSSQQGLQGGGSINQRNSSTRISTKEQERMRAIEKGNLRLLSNLQGAQSCIPRSTTVPPRIKESSRSVNRRTEAQRVEHENMKMVGRLENIHSGNSKQGTAKVPRGQLKDKNVPIGWTRGIGGRLLPPTKMRWKNSQYDAGDWHD